MKIYAERIKSLRKERGLSQDQLAAMLGVSRSAVGMYETGKREPDFEICEAIADIFNVDMDYLIGRSSIERKTSFSCGIPSGFEPVPQMQKVPLIGNIACGQPITAEENLEGYVDAPAMKQIDFALTCHGDSMIDAGIYDGDIVYIRKQPEVENGQIAAVRIGSEATLKRVYYYPEEGKIILQAANAAYPPMSYSGEELNEISIEGLFIGFTHWMKK